MSGRSRAKPGFVAFGAGYAVGVLRRFAEAGRIGWRARVGESLSRPLAAKTPLREETLLTALGLYLWFSRTRRLAQMLRRLRS